MHARLLRFLGLLLFTVSVPAAAPTNDATQAYPKFVQAQGTELRAGEHAPAPGAPDPHGAVPVPQH